MSGIPKLVQGTEQDRNVFNTVKRFVRDIDLLTDEQIARAHFETWDAARRRANVRVDVNESS
jgi:hypothetical protein